MPAALTRVADRERTGAGYVVEIADGFAAVRDVWSALGERGAALPFSSAGWLATWAATLGREPGVEILAATVRDGAGTPVLALPLMRRSVGGRRVIGFADGGVVDYNAPILGRAAPAESAGARALWRTLRRALPPCDVIRLEKMPLTVAGRPNPLALLPGTPTPNIGLLFDMPQPYADWRQAFHRFQRKEFGRCDRLFDALPDASFGEVVADDRARVLDVLEALQRARIATLGRDYALDAPGIAAFYRTFADGPGLLTALTAEGQVVAALLGLRQGRHYVMLRIAADESYSRLSPARVLILRTMEMLRADGVETFDFGLGDYTYKRKLGGLPVPLCDVVEAGSFRGWPEAARFRAKAMLRENAQLRNLAERMGLGSATVKQAGT